MENIFIQQTQVSASRKFIARVYGWMFVALMISGVTALVTAISPTLLNFIFGGSHIGFYALIIAELALVWYLSANIRKLSPVTASISFLVYSLINGMTLSSIFLVYQLSSIINVFFIAALMFGAMTVYGMFTKTDLMSFARYAMMALTGLIIASVLNFIFRSSMLDWIISIAGVAIFTGLTAYDTQRVIRTAEYADNREAYKNVAIIAALNLYLDFINIFLYLLRIFGNRRK